MVNICLISPRKRGYSLEAPWRGASAMIIIKLDRSDQHDESQCVTLKFSTVNCLWQCSLSV